MPADELHPFYRNVASYPQLPDILTKQIGHFFTHYKDLEKGKWAKVARRAEADETIRLIGEAIRRASSG